MLMSVEGYARIRGVDPRTIHWFTTNPVARRACNNYVPVPEVFCSLRRHAALWGCSSENAIRYQVLRGGLAPENDGRLAVHQADLDWGLADWDRIGSASGKFCRWRSSRQSSVGVTMKMIPNIAKGITIREFTTNARAASDQMTMAMTTQSSHFSPEW